MRLGSKKIIYSTAVFAFLALINSNIFAQTPTKTSQVKASGPKKTIAVARFENSSGINSYIAIGDDFAAQLSDALIQSGRFTVLSRKDLGAVLTEQDLADSGRMSKSLSAQKGKIIPAQILITGNITEFEENTQGGGQGLSIHGITIGGVKSDAHVAVIVQIIDSTTGEILDSQRIEGLADASAFTIGYSGSFSLGSSSFKKTPLGKAVQIAIDRAVVYISDKLGKLSWQGRVVTLKDGLVYVNAGSDAGIAQGETFIICRKGESLIDPETGMDLGTEKTKIGDIIIFEVQTKFSKAKILSSTEQIKTSDLVIKQ
ncbi:MAG: CsgG/HfaB family protein [Candidatus Omnitrophica bacterium]|jgi:curli biogenesis system outer membrane secretion channel CsgG|nr:CsgG/HfaB family protein [Candidatus Omnitrophota bacterium]